jgi:TPR repeat protein
MLISEFRRVGLAAVAAMILSTGSMVLVPSGTAWADDGPGISDDTGPVEAFRMGARAYLSGDFGSALQALDFAAKRGHAIAMWKLGRMYAEGEGVDEDDAKAFDYFRRIANAHADDNPHSMHASVYANAFVQLGTYYRTGLSDGTVEQDMGQAARMFMHAATYFGDPDAQFQLARMYLEGEGVARDPEQCIRWLHAAAKKNHVSAQALLGDMLISGADVRPRPIQGLKWLMIAREHAGPAERDWVLSLLHNARQATSNEEQGVAYDLAGNWLASR